MKPLKKTMVRHMTFKSLNNRFSVWMLVLSFLLLEANLSFCLDWKALEDQVAHSTIETVRLQVTKNPGDINQLFALGLLLLKNYKNQEARQVFQKIVDIDALSNEGRWGLAEVLKREHHYDESIEILKQIIKRDPDFAPAYITYSYIRYLQTSFKESADILKVVIEMGAEKVGITNSMYAHALYAANKGMLAYFGGPFAKVFNFNSVKKHLVIAKQLKPESPEVYFGFGSYYMLIPSMLGQDIEKAEEYFLKTIEMDPKFPEAYVRLAQLHKKRGDEVLYEIYLNKALDLDPQNELALDIKNGSCKFICLE